MSAALHPTSRAAAAQRQRIARLRAVYPLYQMRMRGMPVVGARVAGHRELNGSHWGIYRHPGSLYGQTDRAEWYRRRDRATYSVSTTLLGEYVFVDAVVDDFGNLVRVPS